MRTYVYLFVIVIFAACSTAPVARNESQTASPAPTPAAQSNNASTDHNLEYLLTSAASDFRAHRPPDPARFREVRFGHLKTAGGNETDILCGQFQPSQGGDKAEWMPFVTIKTSGYEQYLGNQANTYCRDPSAVWQSDIDLSSTLQSRLDSMR